MAIVSPAPQERLDRSLRVAEIIKESEPLRLPMGKPVKAGSWAFTIPKIKAK